MTEPGCRFCRANGLLSDSAVLETQHFYVLSSLDPALQRAGMIVPHRHSENPFEMTPEEWADFGPALAAARDHFSSHQPDGFTLGWNVGAVGGQNVFHTHLHIIPRFAGEPLEGKGIRHAFKQQGKIA